MPYGRWNWDPFRELEALRREIDRAFEGFGPWRPFTHAAFVPGRATRVYPLLNVSEDKENLYVEALAPGLDPGFLEVSVQHGTLRIAGEKQALSQDIKPEAFHRNERSAGKFIRTVDLPAEVDSERVSADYRNGLLLITLPKTEAAKPKRIPVSVA